MFDLLEDREVVAVEVDGAGAEGVARPAFEDEVDPGVGGVALGVGDPKRSPFAPSS